MKTTDEPEFYPTPHLIQKMNDRQVTWGEILDVLDDPDVIFGPDHRGRRTVQTGNLAVVISKEGAVITVLLRQEEKWTDEDARSRGKAAK